MNRQDLGLFPICKRQACLLKRWAAASCGFWLLLQSFSVLNWKNNLSPTGWWVKGDRIPIAKKHILISIKCQPVLVLRSLWNCYNVNLWSGDKLLPQELQSVMIHSEGLRFREAENDGNSGWAQSSSLGMKSVWKGNQRVLEQEGRDREERLRKTRNERMRGKVGGEEWRSRGGGGGWKWSRGRNAEMDDDGEKKRGATRRALTEAAIQLTKPWCHRLGWLSDDLWSQ